MTLKDAIKLAEPEHIHTCGPDCQKPLCVNRRREIAAAVEAEREDMADYAAALAEPDAKREPATVEQVIAASAPWWSPSPSVDFFSGFRAAERHYGITKEDKA